MLEHIQTLSDLKTAIQCIVVKDYGDFKRKTVLYINRYKEATPLNLQQQKIVTEMMDKIQFHPNFNIESTRAWTLDQLGRL